MTYFGLIGFPLSHSFSKKYFTEKFKKAGITDSRYELFPMENLDNVRRLTEAYPNLIGLNVTIPHKQAIFQHLDAIDAEAAAVGAVNTIKIKDDQWMGFNTDIYGFEQSLRNTLDNQLPKAALILGTGGAAKAVHYVLKKLGINTQFVSRSAGDNRITYHDLTTEVLGAHHLIVNTTPLGTFPDIHAAPDLDYAQLSSRHILFDLVYNPAETLFLKNGKKYGAMPINGLEMLYLQAEKAYDIWTNK